MKNILKYTLVSVVAAVLSSSCIKETIPAGSTATQGMVSASSSALKAMVGAIPVNMAYPYSVFGRSNNRGFDFGYPAMMIITDACTGDIVCTTGDDGSGYDWFTFWKNGTGLGPTNTYSQFAWLNAYTFIKACNDVIGAIQGDHPTTEQRTYLAQAKAFRAQLYLDMARQFEALPNDYTDVSAVTGLTVPLILETTSETDARNNPRLTRDEMFAWLFDELNEAVQLLDGITVSSTNVPSQAVCYGIMARAYLWLGGFDQSNYAKAAEYARKAIDASGCVIMTEAEWCNPTTGFNTPNNSWMWSLPQSKEGVTNLVNYVAWMSPEATWGYASLIGPGVSSNFYAQMSDTDWRKKMIIGDDVLQWYDENGKLANLTPDNAETVEKGTTIEDYVYPYCFMKFRPGNGNFTDYKTGNVTSIPMMRVEEMYLIEAEATAYADPSEGARLLGEFMATRDPDFTLASASTVDVVEAAIWNKRIELWGEGVVFYDFKRLNMGIHTGYTGTNVPSDVRFDIQGRAPWWNFCIPEKETQQNEALKDKNNPNFVGTCPVWK